MPAPKDPKKREEWIEKLRKARQGKTASEETREKMRKAKQGEKNPMYGRGQDRVGEKNSNYGKKHPGMNAGRVRSDMWGENNPNYGKDFSGENNPNFKGGINKGGYHWTCNDKLITEVRERDNYTCQGCGEIWIEGERKFDTHHIYGNDDKDQSCDKTKLITLCPKCHKEVQINFADYISQFEIIVNQEVVWCGT